MEQAIMESGIEIFGSGQIREEEVITQKELLATVESPPHTREETLIISRNGDSPISRIRTTPVGITIADTEAENVLHLLAQKQQVRGLESKPPDPNFPQSSNWSDMIEEEVEDQLQISKDRYKSQWQLQPHTLPATRFRSRSRTGGIANDKSQNCLSKIINKWEPDIVGIVEPMINPNNLPINFLQSLGMSSALYSNPSSDPNRVPNLWLIWKDSVLTPTMIHFSNQHITVMVDSALITIVHAHCLYVQRRHLCISIPRPNNMPFKFFNMWCCHPNFREVVMDSWQAPIMGHSIYILTQKPKRLKGILKKWNKDTFGNIIFKVEEETKKLKQMHEQFENGNVTEDFTMNMVDQENQVEFML
ncbi:hypothetical protein IFM89_029413 [Coptis chinensis]|uniref:Uncharacterized protein n=1 Tax=Coptis chinensis TaxID=261450 RepID=A0A835IRA1_9MAGN|nr:hypothetical protein IFM89_029413 [Coptis chinensis]